MTNKTTRSAVVKSNSPVRKTGQGNTLKKRLLRSTPEEETRGKEKILLAARECFSRQGFAGTSIKDIQIQADCSRGNLYHYFKTKEEIVQSIITQNLGIFSQRIESILEKSNEQDVSLKDVIEELSEFAEQITKGPGRGMAFHVWSLAMVDPEVRETMVKFFEQIRSSLEKKIIVLMSKGKMKKIQNTNQLSVVLFGLVIPAFTLQSVYMDSSAISAKEFTESLFLIFDK